MTNDNYTAGATGDVGGNIYWDNASIAVSGTSYMHTSAGTSIQFIYPPNGGYWTVENSPLFKSKNVINPRLFFSFVKSKMTKLQQKSLSSNLRKLQSLIKEAKELGQQALYEELSQQLYLSVKELEFLACGFDKIVKKDGIDKFLHSVKDDVVYLKKLEEFPRAIPTKVNRKIKMAQKLGLFDEYWILYIDYTKGKENIKSTKEKIREKDPIVFGKLNAIPDNFYFIADWVDEYCDITLSSFIDRLKETDEEYKVDKIQNMSPEIFEKMKTEVIARYEKLKSTNRDNYKELMQEEERKWEAPKTDKKAIKRFLKYVYKKFVGKE